MSQIGIPTEVTPQEVMREKTLGGAIDLCLKAAGLEPKAVQQELKLDKAQFSRWSSGGEGIVWPKLVSVMDFCGGNDAPLMWMNHDRGYDITCMRKLKSETEKALDFEREARKKAEEKVRYFEEMLTGRRTAA